MSVKKTRSFLLRHEYLIWILCACALLRLPSLLEPYWYGDEGIYLTLGNAIRHGLHLYKEIHDNKPPIIYLMAALTGTVFWFRFFLLLWNSVAIVAFERLARMLLGETNEDGTIKIVGISFPKIRWSTLATGLFAVLPFFAEGAIANGEIFMIMPTILGMLFLWNSILGHRPQATVHRSILAGLMFSLAFLIKVPALFDAVAAGFFFFIVIPSQEFKKTNIKSLLTSYVLPLVPFAVAFLLPIIFSVLYYSILGVGKQYIGAAFAQNIGYLSSWATGTHASTNVGSSGLKTRAILLVVGICMTWILAKRNGKALTFLIFWFICALFGALLSERPYPHYLIQIMPPLALLLTYGIRLFVSRKDSNSLFIPLISFSICLSFFVGSILKIRFWYYPLFPYYRNYLSFVSGNKTKDAYLSYFDARLPVLYEAASFVANRTAPSDRIFAWGDVPMLYALSRRLPPGRYTSSYHIKDFNGFAETSADISRVHPKYIVIDSLYEPMYPELASELNENYVFVREAGSFMIYKYFPHQVQ